MPCPHERSGGATVGSDSRESESEEREREMPKETDVQARGVRTWVALCLCFPIHPSIYPTRIHSEHSITSIPTPTQN